MGFGGGLRDGILGGLVEEEAAELFVVHCRSVFLISRRVKAEEMRERDRDSYVCTPKLWKVMKEVAIKSGRSSGLGI